MDIADKRNQVVVRVAALDVMQDNRKHVRSNASDTVIRTVNRFKAVRNRAENVIANFDGIRGIDGTEAINIQKSDRKDIVGAFCRHIDIIFQFFQEILAVINACQSILINIIVIIAFYRLVIDHFCQRTDNTNRTPRFITLDTPANHKLRILLVGIKQSQVARESSYSLQSLIQLFTENIPITFNDAVFQRFKRIFKGCTFSSEHFCNAVRPINLPCRHIKSPKPIRCDINHHLEHFILFEKVFFQIANRFNNLRLRDFHVIANLFAMIRRELVKKSNIRQKYNGQKVRYKI